MNALKLILIFGLLPAACVRRRHARAARRPARFRLGNRHLEDAPETSATAADGLDHAGSSTKARQSSRKVWDGRANLVELDVKGPAGAIEALSLRLYNPDSRQWSLNFSNSRGGTMAIPAIGEFKNGRGEFYNQDTLNGRSIFVKFIIQCESARRLQVRAVVFRRRWPDLGAELDRDRHAGKELNGAARRAATDPQRGMIAPAGS